MERETRSVPAENSRGAGTPLKKASMPSGYREICARLPDPRCDDKAAEQCSRLNQGSAPARVCLFHGNGGEGPLDEGGSSGM